MKKATIIGLVALLVLAASSLASAANYAGVGLGIVGLDQAGAGSERGFIGTAGVDLDLIDKLSVSANGYVEYRKPAEGEKATFGYFGGGYVKYALMDLDALKLGAQAGVIYNKDFAPKNGEEGKLDYGAGIYAEQALGDTGVIYAQGSYWLGQKAIGGLGGLKFKITDKIGVRGQVEYVNKNTLFSIGAGYQF